MSGAPNAKVNADSHGAAAGWRLPAVAGILILAAVVAYWNSFNVPFLLDDQSAIGEVRNVGFDRGNHFVLTFQPGGHDDSFVDCAGPALTE